MILHCIVLLLIFVAPWPAGVLHAQAVKASHRTEGKQIIITLSNRNVECSVVIDSPVVQGDNLSPGPAWVESYGKGLPSIETNAGFAVEVMWTDWSAPKMLNNAENPVRLTNEDFLFDRYTIDECENGAGEINLYLSGNSAAISARLAYRLEPDAFYIRKSIALSDTATAGHFCQNIWPMDAIIKGKSSIVKPGGFGQPVAIRIGRGGGFFGLEYPAADNSIEAANIGARVRCGQEIGEKIGKNWLSGETAVEGLTPDEGIKRWFMRYVDKIRLAPLSPYTLYNSWYDLRSAEYPGVRSNYVMNEENVFRIIGLIRKNMIEKHHIPLDAFVLDDGWDVYESDWVLRAGQFPNGLKPIADRLKETNTRLGMWFGPTGGYSFRMKRIGWMKEHGYEVVGHTRNTAMLCVAGEQYHRLLKTRVTDFVRNDGVGYFKWDGIQFSCSEPNHGHPVGMYSRRAVMESVVDLCGAVRTIDPAMFLNITSGTWLSPWWLKYANQIWMQGQDYGYADVPSISPRDAAITYRDFILYDDFTNNNFWFPIANLMTHGIIKGNLEMLGGSDEPLDKFTNEVLLYFARGVSMWELYISPDILTGDEWDAMSQAMHWARDRFPVLSSTEMVGGDPTKREPYGYVHFKGRRGIIAVRNPWIEQTTLPVRISPLDGLDPDASNLVLEQVYPQRWISPKLHAAGATIELPLGGYETAVYELHPLDEATEPMIAGAAFNITGVEGNDVNMTVYDPAPDAAILNPAIVRGIAVGDHRVAPRDLHRLIPTQDDPVDRKRIRFAADDAGMEIALGFSLDSSSKGTTLAILLTSAGTIDPKSVPNVNVLMDGREDTAKAGESEGRSMWYTCPVIPGVHEARLRVRAADGSQWTGEVVVWLICRQQRKGIELSVKGGAVVSHRPMPPRPFPADVIVKNIKLGEAQLNGSSDR